MIRNGVLAVAAGILAGLAVIAAVNFGYRVAIAICGGFALLAGLVTCGNPRLFFLWGVPLAAPLVMSKVFMPYFHMGGASAIHIDVIDVFLVPLILFQARDFLRSNGKSFRLPYTGIWWGLFIAAATHPVRDRVRTRATRPMTRAPPHNNLR